MSADQVEELQRIYNERFAKNLAYRRQVWGVLLRSFFQKYIDPNDAVLDLGCGYGEFINAVNCGEKMAMDLNPDAPKHLESGTRFLQQDCSTSWALESDSLDVVFTSNFFEHLPDKSALGRTLSEAHRCLKAGGTLIAMGPNIKFLPGQYWDFWDHYLPLTELSLSEGLVNRGFEIVESFAKFLPFTMVRQRQYPARFLDVYLKLPIAWRVFGKQFLIVAQKRAGQLR